MKIETIVLMNKMEGDWKIRHSGSGVRHGGVECARVTMACRIEAQQPGLSSPHRGRDTVSVG